ncbi:MAG: hypothetical protein OXP09_11910 [Gammaproteobacteria bacterium]|nr:hypothetical protein [Gammaproteobacteria bacterium]MDE0366266.1 hypothetical protein [Gammaproteobacteria bacterium]
MKRGKYTYAGAWKKEAEEMGPRDLEPNQWIPKIAPGFVSLWDILKSRFKGTGSEFRELDDETYQRAYDRLREEIEQRGFAIERRTFPVNSEMTPGTSRMIHSLVVSELAVSVEDAKSLFNKPFYAPINSDIKPDSPIYCRWSDGNLVIQNDHHELLRADSDGINKLLECIFSHSEYSELA